MGNIASTSLLGLIIMLGVIGIPVYVLVFASMLGGPRVGHVRGVFVGTVLVLLAGAILLSWIGGAILSLVVPR